MIFLKHVLYTVALPALYFATYWEVRKRVFTNMYLTMTRLGQTKHLETIKCIVFDNLATIILDKLRFLSLLLPFWFLKRLILRQASVVGIEKLDKALDKDRGAIIYSCHIGHYYLIPAMLALLGYRTVVVEKFGIFETPLVKRQVRRLNDSQGHTVLWTETIYDDLLLRKLTKHLQDGKVIFIMGDYRSTTTGRSKRLVKFLGYDIVPGWGIAWLHRKTEAPIFPVMVQYGHCQKPYIEVLNKLDVNKKQPIEHITQAVYRVAEQKILEAPQRWALWMDYHLMLAPEVRNASLDNNTTIVAVSGCTDI